MVFMMRNYKITVNGKTYEVGVEEVGGAQEVRYVQPVAPPAPAPVAPPPMSAPSAPPVPAAAPAPASTGENVLAPLPGTVISVSVKPGDTVKLNQVLLIFEAMKMENEIVASRDGTVVEVYVAKGDVLESGKPVVSLA